MISTFSKALVGGALLIATAGVPADAKGGGGNCCHSYYYGGYGGWGPWAGFGTGVVVGALVARPYYGYGPYYARPYRLRANYGSRDAYCHARFRSYNSYTHTYTGYDGLQHRC
jgi:hypothetical protein